MGRYHTHRVESDAKGGTPGNVGSSPAAAGLERHRAASSGNGIRRRDDDDARRRRQEMKCREVRGRRKLESRIPKARSLRDSSFEIRDSKRGCPSELETDNRKLKTVNRFPRRHRAKRQTPNAERYLPTAIAIRNKRSPLRIRKASIGIGTPWT